MNGFGSVVVWSGLGPRHAACLPASFFGLSLSNRVCQKISGKIQSPKKRIKKFSLSSGLLKKNANLDLLIVIKTFADCYNMSSRDFIKYHH
jgi:hypothetical protein